MRAPRVLFVFVLIASLSLMAAGQDQPNTAQNGPEVVAGINAQDGDPKPCHPGERTAADAVDDSANHPRPETSIKPLHPTALGPQRAIPAVPVNPPTVIFPPGKPEPISLRDIYWEDLFVMIGFYNRWAEQADRAGKHAEAEGWRTSHQQTAGLDDSEGEILQEIAHDCNCAVKELDAKLKASAEKFRAQLVPGSTVTIPVEFVQMSEDRKKIIRDHVEQLRLALGDSSFKKLEIYASSLFPAPASVAKPAPTSTTGENRKEKR
jgi:hypothetical protein